MGARKEIDIDLEKLYIHTEKIHNTRSANVIIPLIIQLLPVRSVLDVGCGTGTWLKVFQEQFGLTDIFGIDGTYVEVTQLVIDQEYFMRHDLRQSFNLNRQFDLVVCLEVAEHLPAPCAETLILSLCKHSKAVLFSAAIPGQGGQNHVNEQWISYWESFFNKLDYHKADVIRPLIWNNTEVDVWYRQNIYLFVHRDYRSGLNTNVVQAADIHPELWMRKTDALKRLADEVNGFDKGNAGIERSFKALINALWKKFLKKFLKK